MRSVRLWIVVALMCCTAFVLHVRGDEDRVPSSRPLTEIPSSIGTRHAIDVPIDDDTLAILGKGFYLNRRYLPTSATRQTETGGAAEVQLFIAYLPTQRSGQSIHSPLNCLPGAGWTIESSDIAHFDASGVDYAANDKLITNGDATDEVLYWYQLHGRSIASDYRAKVDTLMDSIRYGRTDEALVRIITPVAAGESRAAARDRVVRFAQQIITILPAYVPN